MLSSAASRPASAQGKGPTVATAERFLVHVDQTGLDARSDCGSVVQMKRELKPAEREEIVAAVAAGDRVKATSIYLSATQGNLSEAQNFIKALMEERVAALEAEEQAR